MRGRNRNNKGPNPLTRTYESNGPDVKIRGTAQHIAEKYSQLSRDAQAAGDTIAAESYSQHAEHYFRIIAASQEQMRQQYGQYPRFSDEEGEEGEGGEDSGNGFGYEGGNDQQAGEDMDYAFQPQPPYESSGEGRQQQQQRPQRRSRYGRMDRNYNDQQRGDGEGQGDEQGGMRRRSRYGRQQHDQQQPAMEQQMAPPPSQDQPAPAPQRRSRSRQETPSDDGSAAGLPAFLTMPVRQTAPARTEPNENLFAENAASEEAPKPVRRRRRVTTESDNEA